MAGSPTDRGCEFGHSALGRGIVARVGFRDEEHAAAFASAFSGRLESTDSDRAVAPGSMSRPAGNDAGPSFLKGSTVSGDLLPQEVQRAAKALPAGVSLMITRQQKADLRELGYTDDQIRDMKPEEAHRVLGLID